MAKMVFLFLKLFLQCNGRTQTLKKILVLGFKLRISCVGSYCSASCASTTARRLMFLSTRQVVTNLSAVVKERVKILDPGQGEAEVSPNFFKQRTFQEEFL